jgi:hypothetical protein
MDTVLPLPAYGCLLPDVRGADRMLRVTWHHEAGIAVLSLWRGDTCAGTVRLDRADVPELVAALVEGLAVDVRPAGALTDAG